MSNQVTLRQVAAMLGQVGEMNTAFGKPAPQGAVDVSSLQSQIACIEEEIDELAVAVAENNLTGMRDAICDILVFAFGVAHLGKFPVSALVTPCSNIHPDIGSYVSMFRSAFSRLSGKDNLAGVRYETTLIVEYALEMSVMLGMDIEADMDAVYQSNMSKFCTNPEEMDASINQYAQKGVKVVPKGEYPRAYVVSLEDQKDGNGKFYPEGKFLKGVGFFEPQFAENKSVRYAIQEASYSLRRGVMKWLRAVGKAICSGK